MKNKIAAFVLSVAASFASTGAFAQTNEAAAQSMGGAQGMGQKLQARFANANTTHDGKLTKAQAASGMPMVAKHFDQIDTQGNGYVTLPQIAQFMHQRGASH